MLRRLTALLLSLSLLALVPAGAAGTGTYSDVPPGDWSVPAIQAATEHHLMDGIGGGKFGYGLPMNRASFVTVLCRMFGWAAVTPAAPSFSDCAPENWAFAWVEAALKNGAVVPSAVFRPDDPITREEMAVMLVRALDYDLLAAAQAHEALPFSDVTTSVGYIALAYRFGIIGGIETGDGLAFCPQQWATREQAAAMLVRTYGRMQSKTDWLHGFYAQRSYPQIDLTAKMDAVSVGWARLEAGPTLNQSTAGGNEWAVPQQSHLATDVFQKNGTPCNLMVFSSGTPLTAALESETARSHAADLIAAAAAAYSGVTIDFEGLRAPQMAGFTAFISTLRAALPAEKLLYVCVQPPDWYDGYDYRALGTLCDKVILMAHDYQSADLPTVGAVPGQNPVAPLTAVYRTLATVTGRMADPKKLALAISFSSSGYEVDANGKIAATALVSPGPGTIAQRLRQPDTVRGWSDLYRSPYLDYTADGKRYRVWYEDAQSVAEKVRLAGMFGVTSLSLWRVGTIPAEQDPALHYDVWRTVLERR